jgi:uncharacterized protein GlcG (DUF336 family)
MNDTGPDNEIHEVTLYIARKGLDAAEHIADDIIGWPCSIAVVDKAGAVVAAHRMEGAPPATFDIAVEKAWSAATFLAPTLILGRMTDPRSALAPFEQLPFGHHGMGLQFKHKGRLTTIMGGVPIRDRDMKVIGAVGTSGTPSAKDDNTVSQAGWSSMYDEEDRTPESTLREQVEIVLAALKKAESQGLRVSVTLSDPEGWPVVIYRMDGALFPTAELSRDKAWTAAAFKMPSSEIDRFGVEDAPGLGIPTSGWNERVCPIPGGLPLIKDDRLLGSVGVCGGTPGQDVRVAKAAVKKALG